MKTEDQIKEALEAVKNQIPLSSGEETRMLQGQYSALQWLLDDEKKDG